LNISHAVLPNGKTIPLLKTLQTSACERDCNYCPFRSGRDFKRASLQPDEMASAFMALVRSGIVRGMFLSSGVAGGGVRTQDQLLATAEILRNRHHFAGYIHLKLMPGSEYAQIERAMELADRVSINLEAPNPERLEKLAPHKSFFDELLQPLKWAEQLRKTQPGYRARKGYWPSTTTQFVVGVAGESDQELLASSKILFQEYRLARVYYSAFSPVPDTPFENQPPTAPLREQRLYQSSMLLKDYEFALGELPFLANGDLPLDTDPKSAWAKQHLAHQPIEINTASRHDLLRIPGIGLKGAQKIIAARMKGKINELSELKRLGVKTQRLVDYVLLNGRQPNRQRSFWAV
jgi:predicted DNA-binding helix-hairpin-helix protein